MQQKRPRAGGVGRGLAASNALRLVVVVVVVVVPHISGVVPQSEANDKFNELEEQLQQIKDQIKVGSISLQITCKGCQTVHPGCLQQASSMCRACVTLTGYDAPVAAARHPAMC